MKPVAISLISCSKAEGVGCPGRKPYWPADGGGWLLTVGSKRAFITFAVGQRSEIVWLELLKGESLPGYRIGMTMADFQIDGIRQESR